MGARRNQSGMAGGGAARMSNQAVAANWPLASMASLSGVKMRQSATCGP
jgi:hypothetical protein